MRQPELLSVKVSVCDASLFYDINLVYHLICTNFAPKLNSLKKN